MPNSAVWVCHAAEAGAEAASNAPPPALTPDQPGWEAFHIAQPMEGRQGQRFTQAHLELGDSPCPPCKLRIQLPQRQSFAVHSHHDTDVTISDKADAWVISVATGGSISAHQLRGLQVALRAGGSVSAALLSGEVNVTAGGPITAKKIFVFNAALRSAGPVDIRAFYGQRLDVHCADRFSSRVTHGEVTCCVAGPAPSVDVTGLKGHVHLHGAPGAGPVTAHVSWDELPPTGTSTLQLPAGSPTSLAAAAPATLALHNCSGHPVDLAVDLPPSAPTPAPATSTPDPWAEMAPKTQPSHGPSGVTGSPPPPLTITSPGGQLATPALPAFPLQHGETANIHVPSAAHALPPTTGKIGHAGRAARGAFYEAAAVGQVSGQHGSAGARVEVQPPPNGAPGPISLAVLSWLESRLQARKGKANAP